MIIGFYCGIRDGWNSVVSSDILFIVCGSFWDVLLLVVWVNIVYIKDVLFVYGFDSG